jgi:hypothetical protein
MLNAVESKKHSFDQHPPQTDVASRVGISDNVQPFFQPFNDTVDVRENDLLFTFKVQVNTALTDAGLPREVLDRHLPVTVLRKQFVGCVEYLISRAFMRI